MATRLEILIAQRFTGRIRGALTASDILTALQELDQNTRTKLIDMARKNDAEVGRVFLGAVNAYVDKESLSQAQSMLADGSLTIAELNNIFDF